MEKNYPWEFDARCGNELPEGLALWEQSAYLAMRSIYMARRQNFIDIERMVRELSRVRARAEKNRLQEQFVDRRAGHYASMIRATEQYRQAVRHDPSPENARALVDALDGVL